MRFRIAFLSLTIATFAALQVHAQEAAPSIEDQLANYIAHSQLTNRADARANGEWEIYSILNGSATLGAETDSFLTAQQLVALTEVNRYRPLPGFSQIRARVMANMQTYLADVNRLGDPAGTIAYFPIIDAATGTRGVQIPVTRLVKSFNVPPDLDSSSALAMDYELNGGGAGYLSSYISTIGRYRDLDRTVEHAHDRQWKEANSGAFMTWAEGDQVVNPHSRIMGGINDVDCIVDLNVLAAASSYRRSHGALPAATQAGVNSTCSLINDTVEAGRFAGCALWYDRPSQFWYAYSRAVTDGAKCLASSVDTARANIVAEVEALTKANPVAAPSRTTQSAELLIALKRLYPVASRPARIQQDVANLDAQLRLLTTVKDGYAYPMTQDSLYLANGYGMRLDWFSAAYSASIELLALSLP